jgi:hypothetical protein
MSEIYVINYDEYPRDPTERAMTLATEVVTAFGRAEDGDVTCVYVRGRLIATITPPEAGERYMHANEVLIAARQHEETVPALVRTERRRSRRSWWTWGPFEGLF